MRHWGTCPCPRPHLPTTRLSYTSRGAKLPTGSPLPRTAHPCSQPAVLLVGEHRGQTGPAERPPHRQHGHAGSEHTGLYTNTAHRPCGPDGHTGTPTGTRWQDHTATAPAGRTRAPCGGWAARPVAAGSQRAQGNETSKTVQNIYWENTTLDKLNFTSPFCNKKLSFLLTEHNTD